MAYGINFVTEMLESVFQVKPDDQGIEKMFRLGRRDANNRAPRPLLVGWTWNTDCGLKHSL